MNALPLLDLIEASSARDRGIALAASRAPNFLALALDSISRMTPGMEVQGEDIRVYLIERGIEPASHKCWGALCQAAIKRGLLIPTGRYQKTKSVKTHRHATATYYINSTAR